MPTSSVLLGSYPSIPATTVQVTANAVQENLSWTAATKYLYHPTGSLSLLTAWATLLNTHSELASAAAVIARSGKVRTTSAVAFSVDSWGSDTTLRDLLGHTGTLSSGTAHVATNRSPLYWAPGKTESPTARLGSSGTLVKDTHAGRSAPGVVVATTNNQWYDNGFRWNLLLVDNVEQVPDVPGTFSYFWDNVLSRFRRFWLARSVFIDDSNDTSALVLNTKIPASGAYIWKHDAAVRREHVRGIENLEVYANVEIAVETAREYT